MECDDGRDCTTDACAHATGCFHGVKEGSCLIDGVCRDPGAGNPGNPCEVCAPDTEAGGWSAAEDGTPCASGLCDGLTFYAMRTCEAGACSESAAAIACDDGVACTTDSCDAAAGCGNALSAGYCRIEGHATARGRRTRGMRAGCARPEP